MKNIKVSGFEIYILQEALKHYKSLVLKEEFPKNSIVTKEYVEMMIAEIERKLAEKLLNKKTEMLNAN